MFTVAVSVGSAKMEPTLITYLFVNMNDSVHDALPLVPRQVR
jgi:hypothetical protein